MATARVVLGLSSILKERARNALALDAWKGYGYSRAKSMATARVVLGLSSILKERARNTLGLDPLGTSWNSTNYPGKVVVVWATTSRTMMS